MDKLSDSVSFGHWAAGIGGLGMELQEAIAAYRERITHVLSQADPPPTDEWLKDKTDELMAPFEGLVSEQPSSP